jgi:hypothetical protein
MRRRISLYASALLVLLSLSAAGTAGFPWHLPLP